MPGIIHRWCVRFLRFGGAGLVAFALILLVLHTAPARRLVLGWMGSALSGAIGLPVRAQTLEYNLLTGWAQVDGLSLGLEGTAALLQARRLTVRLPVLDMARGEFRRAQITVDGLALHHQVMRGWEMLRRHDVDVNILCTIHAANADHPLEVYRFFRDKLETKFMQFIPIVERTTEDFLPLANLGWGERPGSDRPLYTQHGGLVTERTVGAEQFGRFLIAIFDEWVRRDVGKVFVQTFDVALGSWIGQHNLCIFSPTCGSALALEHNGDLYSCDHYVEPDYLLGNIAETHMAELVASPKQRAFGQHKLSSLPKYCRECEVKFACWGECPRNRFITTPDGEPGLNYLCAGYKLFFNHIDPAMKTMAGLLQQGRFADEIMQMHSPQNATQAGGTKVGRNDPCPCGSGTKYKHCHLSANSVS